MNISLERKKQIEEIVSEIIKTKNINFDNSPSVDIVSLVEQDGFKVEPQLMPLDTTGCIFVNDDSPNQERLITVNKLFKNPDNEDEVTLKKSRFITAHEYGHFILHKPQNQPLYAHRDSDRREETFELEADYFARSILMPLNTFSIVYNLISDLSKDSKNSNFLVNILSRMFKVTSNKVKLRIEDLNILNVAKEG